MKPVLLKRIDLEPDTVSLFNRIADMPGSILLDSGMLIEGLSRYSYMSADPFLVLTSRGSRVRIERRRGPGAGTVEEREENPLDTLAGLMSQYRLDVTGYPAPFFGGVAGFFAYDLGRQLESLPETALDDTGTPDCWLGFYDLVAALDHTEGSVYITCTGLAGDGEPENRLAWLEELLCGRGRGGKNCIREEIPAAFANTLPSGLVSDFTRESYCAVVEKAREYIAAGDIFQVNLSQRFRLPRQENPWQIYRRLRSINPAPMAAYINCGDLQVVSASPERFMKVAGSMVETRPIKGTRPRGKNPAGDSIMREELWKSEKDRAELVMIVDLERNDLGRVCVPGSVHVPELYRLEEYPTVYHLVSTVVGELEEGRGVVDLLKASFPGGSITGAPKIRAMEIIEELEPVRRGIYCGSIGYLAFNGDADLNIVIRTLVFTEDSIFLQVGGGLTIDSDPHSEYLETLDKARALVRALGLDI